MDAPQDTDSNWLVALDKSLAAQILRAIILAIVMTSAAWLLARYVPQWWLR